MRHRQNRVVIDGSSGQTPVRGGSSSHDGRMLRWNTLSGLRMLHVFRRTRSGLSCASACTVMTVCTCDGLACEFLVSIDGRQSPFAWEKVAGFAHCCGRHPTRAAHPSRNAEDLVRKAVGRRTPNKAECPGKRSFLLVASAGRCNTRCGCPRIEEQPPVSAWDFRLVRVCGWGSSFLRFVQDRLSSMCSTSDRTERPLKNKREMNLFASRFALRVRCVFFVCSI